MRAHGVDRDAERIAALRAGRNVVPGVDDALFASAVDTGRLHFGTDLSVASQRRRRAAVRPHAGGRPPARPVLHRGRRPRPGAAPARRARSSSWSRRRTRAPPSRCCCRCSRSRACAAARTSCSPTPPSASTPATRSTACATPRGSSAASAPRRPQAVTAFYAQIVDEVVTLSSPRAAELAKLLENTFRMVNIALVNELAQLCAEQGIDTWEVIQRRREQAVRLHALLPRSGRRRPLHPARPDLPRLAVPARHRTARSAWSRRLRTSTPRCRPTSPAGSSRR